MLLLFYIALFNGRFVVRTDTASVFCWGFSALLTMARIVRINVELVLKEQGWPDYRLAKESGLMFMLICSPLYSGNDGNYGRL